MDLWILSQEKDLLIKVNHICYRCVSDSKNRQLHIITNDDYDFGLYKTKERALEVLGEIQKLLTANLCFFQDINIEPKTLQNLGIYNAIVCGTQNKNPRAEFIHRDCVVFEMPEN